MRNSCSCPGLPISIHALREEGDYRWRCLRRPDRGISIHALREEGDKYRRLSFRCRIDFYPRPPRGGRLALAAMILTGCGFLSTPSARRATRRGSGSAGSNRISIHALREEGDHPAASHSVAKGGFLSTPSARRATRLGVCQGAAEFHFYPRPPRGGRRGRQIEANVSNWISIHALREEGDLPLMVFQTPHTDFYPRPPRGGRRLDAASETTVGGYFYPRPPRGGRPASSLAEAAIRPISIHALREEGDTSPRRNTVDGQDFYPRPPRGGRRPELPAQPRPWRISIHALREEGDHRGRIQWSKLHISIHALREEGDLSSKEDSMAIE